MRQSRINVIAYKNIIIIIINIIIIMQPLQEIVHIIPLGHEFDRAIKPFEDSKPNRIHLLSISNTPKYSEEMLERQSYFTSKVSTFLNEKGIHVVHHDVDLFDILEVMKHVSNIIVQEKSNGNLVLVNMSACGRLTSIGATLAAMAHDVTVYYVSADDYSLNVDDFNDHGLSICSINKTIRFENFEFNLPDKISTSILVELCRYGKGMTTKDIRGLLHNLNVPGFEIDADSIGKAEKNEKRRLEKTKQLMKLEKSYLSHLERIGYICREKSGRNNIIYITDAGRYIAHISGMLE